MWYTLLICYNNCTLIIWILSMCLFYSFLSCMYKESNLNLQVQLKNFFFKSNDFVNIYIHLNNACMYLCIYIYIQYNYGCLTTKRIIIKKRKKYLNKENIFWDKLKRIDWKKIIKKNIIKNNSSFFLYSK